MTIHTSLLFPSLLPRALHDKPHVPARVWVLAVTAHALLPAFLALSLGCCQNDIRKVPTIRGRVVEVKTNKPIAGARLARWFEREDGCLAPGGSDVHSVAGSFLAVTTDNDGAFEWPAWRGLTSPILAMQWYVYHPGWVADHGWFNHPRPGLEGYYFGVGGSEAWVHLVSRPVGSHLEVTITMNPTDSTAAWEAHFQRMVSMTRFGKLEIECFTKDATTYIEKNTLTQNMLVPMAELIGRLQPGDDPQPRQHRNFLVRAVGTFCHSEQVSARCQWPIVANVVREFDLGQSRQTIPP